MIKDLLERDTELGALEAASSAAGGGEGRLVVVQAVAGLGKSQLVDAAAECSAGAGLSVLRARGDELEREFPFGVVTQLLEARLRAEPEEGRRELLGGSAGLAAPLLDPVGTAEPASEASLLHGLFWVCANLADRSPLALLVDDAHWADEGSLRFLHYLAQRVEELPVLVVAATRAAEHEPWRELLERLAAGPAAVSLRPRPLSEEAVDRLVGAWAFPDGDRDPAFSRACFDVTGGNPLLLRELLVAVVEDGVPPTAEGAERVREIGPEPVARAIRLVLGRIGLDATAFARSLAVLGDGAPLASVAELAGLGPDAGRQAAVALEGAGVLRRDNAPTFIHPIVRAAVYEELLPTERATAHGLAARQLTGAGAPPERISAHLVHTSPGLEPEALPVLRVSAQRALARGAPGVAVRHLRRALQEPVAPGERAALLRDLGQAERLAGEAAAALDHLEQSLQLADDAHSRARALLAKGQALWAQGLNAEAAAAFEAGHSEVEADGDGDLRATLETSYFTVARLVPELRPRVLERVEPMLSSPGGDDSPSDRVVLAQVAMERALTGAPCAEVVPLVRRALGGGALIADRTSDDPSFYVIVGILRGTDELELEERVLDEGIDDARARGSVTAFASASYCRAWPRYYRGAIDDAIADAEFALEARRAGWEMFLSATCAVLALARMERGDLAGAESALAEAPESAPTVIGDALVGEARGRVHLAQGRPCEALEELRTAGRMLLETFQSAGVAISPWRSQAALAQAALGHQDEAVRLADEEVELARGFGAPRTLGMALRARGLVGGRDGIPFLEEAVDVLEGSPSVLERTRAALDLGATLRRAGRRKDSREPLAHALDLAAGTGAVALAARARDELAAAGARPRRERLSGPDALTPSERRVAEMAAEGMTNREIAQALFVTVKAVQWHLGNVYPKLGVSGRRELAAELARAPEV